MSHAVCLACGAREFGRVFWRIRGANGSHVADTSSLAKAQELVEKWSGTKYWRNTPYRIYRVTRRPKRATQQSSKGDVNV